MALAGLEERVKVGSLQDEFARRRAAILDLDLDTMKRLLYRDWYRILAFDPSPQMLQRYAGISQAGVNKRAVVQASTPEDLLGHIDADLPLHAFDIQYSPESLSLIPRIREKYPEAPVQLSITYQDKISLESLRDLRVIDDPGNFNALVGEYGIHVLELPVASDLAPGVAMNLGAATRVKQLTNLLPYVTIEPNSVQRRQRRLKFKKFGGSVCDHLLTVGLPGELVPGGNPDLVRTVVENLLRERDANPDVYVVLGIGGGPGGIIAAGARKAARTEVNEEAARASIMTMIGHVNDIVYSVSGEKWHVYDPRNKSDHAMISDAYMEKHGGIVWMPFAPYKYWQLVGLSAQRTDGHSVLTARHLGLDEMDFVKDTYVEETGEYGIFTSDPNRTDVVPRHIPKLSYQEWIAKRWDDRDMDVSDIGTDDKPGHLLEPEAAVLAMIFEKPKRTYVTCPEKFKLQPDPATDSHFYLAV